MYAAGNEMQTPTNFERAFLVLFATFDIRVTDILHSTTDPDVTSIDYRFQIHKRNAGNHAGNHGWRNTF